jgi:hypothetical protein
MATAGPSSLPNLIVQPHKQMGSGRKPLSRLTQLAACIFSKLPTDVTIKGLTEDAFFCEKIC